MAPASEQRKGQRRQGVKALIAMYRSGIAAFFRRKRRPAYDADGKARQQEVTKLAVRVGTGVGKARIRSLFVGRKRRARIREQAALAAAQDVVETMGQMKGLAMKLAQLGSFLMPLPEDAEAELATLQSAAPPMDPDLIVGVLKSEFGDTILYRLGRFDRRPLASASIGQVHRARLHDGREVVMKVQYPGIDKAVLADLDAFDEMTKAATLSGGDFTAYIANMEATLREELDYACEAANQTYFSDLYIDHPFVKIPAVVPDLTKGRVLTSEFVSGERLYDVVRWPQEERNRVGEIIYRFAFGSIFQGTFSADPHPGNYLFMDDGRVCFLDFGFLQRFADPERDAGLVKAPVAAALRGDREGIAAGLRGLGLTPGKGRSNTDRLWEEIRPILFGPIEQDAAVRLDSKQMAAGMRSAVKITSELNKMRKSQDVRPWIAMLLRYGIGTIAVISKLEAEVNWHRVARELVLGEAPTTAIGEKWQAGVGGLSPEHRATLPEASAHAASRRERPLRAPGAG